MVSSKNIWRNIKYCKTVVRFLKPYFSTKTEFENRFTVRKPYYENRYTKIDIIVPGSLMTRLRVLLQALTESNLESSSSSSSLSLILLLLLLSSSLTLSLSSSSLLLLLWLDFLFFYSIYRKKNDDGYFGTEKNIVYISYNTYIFSTQA